MLYDVCVHDWSMCLFECEINVYVRSIYYILRLWNMWLVVCGVNCMWRSVVCGGQWYVGISAMWGNWHGRSTVRWVSGMFEGSDIIDVSGM